MFNIEECAQPIVSFLVRLSLVKVVLVDLAEFLLREASAVGGISQSLPGNVTTSVVEFMLNDDQRSFFVQGQKIESFLVSEKPAKCLSITQSYFAAVQGQFCNKPLK